MSQVTMPKMGEAMEEGTLIRWLKKEGESVEENEAIAEVETDKAAMEIPSFVSGKIKSLLAKEGDVIPVGQAIAVIVADGEADETADAPDERSHGFAGQVPESEAPPQIGSVPNAVPSERPDPHISAAAQASLAQHPPLPPDEGSDRVLASPLAKKIAADAGVDIRAIQGTGPNGRIIEADVKDYLTRTPKQPEAAPAAQPAALQPGIAPPSVIPSTVPGEEVKLSRIRQIIAQRLQQSKQTVPHFYVTTEIDMKAAKEFVAQLKTVEREGRAKPTLTDLIVKACAVALQKYPKMNAQFQGDHLRQPNSINVGVAVALEEGLIVPVIKGCETKSLHQIADVARPLIEKTRAGKLTPDEYTGGTFTISNLGMYDVEEFSAIINPPECAILAVASILDQVVAVNGEIVIRPRMKVTLSADHRAVDGVVGAQFLQELKRLLQTPFLLVE